MKKLIVILFFTLQVSVQGQTPVQVSKIFSSEPQNEMAANIPGLLIEAFRNGDIQAYYPARPTIPMSYKQFLYHFGAVEKAQTVLTSAPPWFCDNEEFPKLDADRIDCLSKKFDLGEKLVENRMTMMNELKLEFIRLVYDSECDPRAIDSFGPIFKLKDIARLTGDSYRIRNPQNDAVNYSIIDILRLRLFAARK